MLLTGRAGELACPAVVDKLVVDSASGKTAHDMVREATGAGVAFKICTTTLEAWGDKLIPEICETVGGAYLISESMDDATVTFTY